MSETRHGFYTPPHSIEAERAVLGAILNNQDQFSLVVDKCALEPKHFFIDTHNKIFAAMMELDEKRVSIDLVSIIEKVSSTSNSGSSGGDGIGADYLVELCQSCPHTQNAEHYADIVKQKFYLRRVIDTCQETCQKALKGGGDAREFLEEVEKTFLSLAGEQDDKGGLKNAKEVLIPTLEELERRINADGSTTGVTSGFSDLDNFTGGWQRSDLIILAARPGMGKTALGLNWALNALKSENSYVTAIFTLEMSKEQLMERLLSSEARIDTVRLRKGDLGEEDQDRLMHGARELNVMGKRLVIDETPGISISQLRSRCRRYQREVGLDLVVVDYLQLMTASATSQKQGREREIGEISMGLKALAKELAVPVIACAQLNRGPDARPDKRPRISDLRESGSMEQDADLILFVYRDDYYNPNSEMAGKAEVIVAKNRHGETGSIHLAWMPNFVSFHNLIRD